MIQNRFAVLCDNKDVIDASQRYEYFIQANKEATESLIPKKTRVRKNDTSDDARVTKARKEVQEAFVIFQQSQTPDNEIQLQRSKASLQRAYEAVLEGELTNEIDKLEKLDNTRKHREAWKSINNISGRKKGKTGILEGKNKEERVQNWHKHFKDLLGREPQTSNNHEEIRTILHDIGYLTGEFTMDELQKAKAKITLGKASGPDNIPPEVIKLCDIDQILLDFANDLLINKQKPSQWSISDIIPVPKKGDLSKGGNYRGISLNAIASKLVNRMILNRIQPILDPHLRPNQNGFRPGRSTTSQILALRRLIEGVKSNNLPAVLLFLDFRKAFDSIHREKMFAILKAYNIPDELVNAIKLLYHNTRAKVVSPDGETEEFEIVAGVLQGDTLAPYLFTIVLDYVMREAMTKTDNPGFTLSKRRSKRHPPVTISDLDFADDIALTLDNLQEAQTLLTGVETAASNVGLHLNAAKTEMIVYNQQIEMINSLNGEQIKSVDDFKYLGSWIDNTLKDMNTRKAQAWVACNKLSKIWKSNLNRNLKARLFTAIVESVLLYGCESWAMNKTTTKQIDGAYTRLLRSAFNISWKDHITNERLYGSIPKVSTKIKERRMRLCGHCFRHNEEIASKLVLWQPDRGRPSRGRRKTTLVDTLLDDTGCATRNELATAMLDRDSWKERIHEVRGLDFTIPPARLGLALNFGNIYFKSF